MSATCPICEGASAGAIYDTTAPVFWVTHDPADTDRFAAVVLHQCGRCGHVWVPHVDSAMIAEIYRKQPAPNAPVTEEMHARYQSLCDFLGGESGLAGSRILEVGGGTGSLARVLARHAERVTVVEPNPELPTLLDDPTGRIVAVNAFFTPDLVEDRADLVICRQVYEHIEDIRHFAAGFAKALQPGGLLYVEVPDARYIERTGAYMDIHVQHLHYFDPARLARLFAGFGFEPVAELDIMKGHDFGLLLRKTEAKVTVDREPEPLAFGGLADLRDRHRAFLAARAGGPAALYGGSAQGVTFFQETGPEAGIVAVLDDNKSSVGGQVYRPGAAVPVEAPSEARIATLSDIYVGAYLHDAPISRKLREQFGFKGPIWSTDPARGEIVELLPVSS